MPYPSKTNPQSFLPGLYSNIISNAKYCLLLILLLNNIFVWAQRDAIYKKDSGEIRCKILKITAAKYSYAFIDTSHQVVQASILKSLVDSIHLNKYDSNTIAHALFNKKTPALIPADAPPKPLQFTAGIGLNLGNILEFNSASGPDKKTFSATTALDLGVNYFKEGNRFAMTNELHWTVAVQKSGLTSAAHIQRATDDLSTLHDLSMAINRSNKWNLNLIVKMNTSVFTIFDGDYFKDFNNNGKIQGFLSPYEVILSPGIKYQPNDYFRFSISPYSVSLYGLRSQQIANTGFYTKAFDTNNNYDRFVFKQLGAELNIWYDRKVKKWLEMQYRLGISSDYFKNIAKNGLMDGLFITKIRIIKNVYLTHRAILKADLAQRPFKPYYNQTVLLSFARSF